MSQYSSTKPKILCYLPDLDAHNFVLEDVLNAKEEI